MDIARLKIITYRAIKTTGTLIVITRRAVRVGDGNQRSVGPGKRGRFGLANTCHVSESLP